jgi:DNA repair exonuclease SbcCD nuclease subunit
VSRPITLAHLADLHLGYRQYERQTARGGNQREADVAEAFRRAVDDLLERRPDLVVIAGDVFHSVRPTNPAILFCFQQLQRLRAALPEAPIVVIAGNHDTPRSSETGSILRLYEALGVELALDQPRRLVFPQLDCAVLAVPHAALVGEDRPALRPEPGATRNVLVVHGDLEGLVPDDAVPFEFGGAPLARAEIGFAQWDYVALGHYHVAREVEKNGWYAGSLEYVGANIWGELREQAELGRPGKGYLLVSVPGAVVTYRSIDAPRRVLDLPAIHGEGLTAREIDARIQAAVESSRAPIDQAVVRLVVYDVSRGVAKDLDHAAIRDLKGRALHFHLDLRRPAAAGPTLGVTATGRRRPLADTVAEFLGRRPLDADVDREAFVALGGKYLTEAAHSAGDESA